MKCLYILALMGAYWMFQALPLPITSLLPIVAFPLAQIASTAAVCGEYFNATMFMFVGGLIMAIGIEASGLHKRLALNILMLKCVRQQQWGIMLGLMIITALLSMWISNTATTAMMIPLVNAITNALYQDKMDHGKRNILLLSIAYAANIGGTGTVTGSPTNLIVLKELDGSKVTFDSWFLACTPLMLANLFCAFIYLNLIAWIASKLPLLSPDKEKLNLFNLSNDNSESVNEDIEQLEMSRNSTNTSITTLNTTVEDQPDGSKNAKNESPDDRLYRALKTEYDSLGPFSSQEGSMIVIFTSLIVLWIMRDPKFAEGYGWGQLLEADLEDGTKITIKAATPAIALSILLFIVPKTWNFWPFQSKEKPSKSSESLLTWQKVQREMPWDVLLLLAGGFALSFGCKESGLSDWIAEKMEGLSQLNPWQINLIISILAAIITEFVSNTATANIFVPILRNLSITLCLNPTYLVMTTVISCSYAFMLPVATAPNALVFTASTMKGRAMICIGFFMNIICVCLTNVAMKFYAEIIFEDFSTIPDWALKNTELPKKCDVQF
eukprot:05229.XXX_19647_17798_1 [CDS] Oithona nana genome sequencing.